MDICLDGSRRNVFQNHRTLTRSAPEGVSGWHEPVNSNFPKGSDFEDTRLLGRHGGLTVIFRASPKRILGATSESCWRVLVCVNRLCVDFRVSLQRLLDTVPSIAVPWRGKAMFKLLSSCFLGQ